MVVPKQGVADGLLAQMFADVYGSFPVSAPAKRLAQTE